MPIAEMLYDHNLATILRAVTGYRRARDKEHKLHWESTRWATFHLMNIQLAVKDKMQHLTDLIQFPWEEESAEKNTVDPEALKFFKIRKPDTQ